MSLRAKPKHGSERCAVVRAAAVLSSENEVGEARPASARRACRVEWSALDLANRSSVARSAEQVSALSDLPSPVSAVAAARHTAAGVTCAGRRSARSRQGGLVRKFHRRHLRGGEKRGAGVGPTRRGKGTKIMAIADRHGLPLAVHVGSASPNEIELVEATLQQAWTPHPPPLLIGDRAYDSDPADDHLRRAYRVKLIAPHKRNRSRARTQDGRELRRYRRRWKVERLFAWLHNFRRIVNRWEYYQANFLAMVQLACAAILLRYF